MESGIFKKRNRAVDIIDYAFEFYRQNFKTFLIIVLIFHVPVIFLINLVSNPTNVIQMLLSIGTADLDKNTVLKWYLFYMAAALLLSLYTATVEYVVNVASSKLTYDKLVLDKVDRPGQYVKYGFKRFLWIVLGNFLISSVAGTALGFIYFVGMILSAIMISTTGNIVLFMIVLIIILIALLGVTLYFWIRICFYTQAIAIETTNIIEAFKYSFKITKKKFWRTLWPIVLNIIVMWILSSVLSAVMFLQFVDPVIAKIAYALAEAVTAVVVPVPIIVKSILYINYKDQIGDLDYIRRLNSMLEGQSVSEGNDRQG
jgi:hypothetical protein